METPPNIYRNDNALAKERIRLKRAKTSEKNKDYSPATVSDFKQIITQFYKFLKGNVEEYPREVKWIKTAIKLNHGKRFEELNETLRSTQKEKRICDGYPGVVEK